MVAAIGFIFGITFGSFVEAAAERLINHKSVLGRSCCPNCEHSLRWYDLFPVFSYLFLRGRCRYCQKGIPGEYLLVEIILGVIFALLFNQAITSLDKVPSLNYWQLSLLVSDLIFKSFVVIVLAIVFLIDLKIGLIPDVITYPAAAAASLYLALSLLQNLWTPVLWAVISACVAFLAFVLIIVVTSGRGMGWGDAKLVVFLGLALGFPNIVLGIFLAFLSGAIVSVFLIIFKKKHFGQTIPFGPFLSVGSVIALIWGKQILDWYLNGMF